MKSRIKTFGKYSVKTSHAVILRSLSASLKVNSAMKDLIDNLYEILPFLFAQGQKDEKKRSLPNIYKFLTIPFDSRGGQNV